MKTTTYILFSLLCTTGFAQINRPADPVIISLSLNYTPQNLVAFRYDSGWQQIPVQVDEKVLRLLTDPYGPNAATTTNVKHLFYADAATYVGADTNTLIDGDDEIVVMASDAGLKADSTCPPFVQPESKKEIRITDPLGGQGYIYLFSGAGSATFTKRVNYTFGPNAPYVWSGRNPENSVITTPKYSVQYTAEWVWNLSLGGSRITDRQKAFYANGYCQRTEETFSDGPGCVIANISGPIRAVRSYMGANSGTYMQRTHIFYEGRQDIITNFRVHAIQAMHDVMDYNSNVLDAKGVSQYKYYNNNFLSGATIDGSSDKVPTGAGSKQPEWELVSGANGSFVHLHSRSTTLKEGVDVTYVGYYDDNKSRPGSTCTGTEGAWGTSGIGMQFASNICTDPIKDCGVTSPYYRTLEQVRTVYIEAPNRTVTTAQQYHSRSLHPLQIIIN